MNNQRNTAGRVGVLSLTLSALWTVAAGAVATDGIDSVAEEIERPAQDIMAVAEDGTPYPIASAADDLAVQRDGWQERKVHPSVSQRAFQEDEVRVIIYLYDNDASRASRVANVKATFMTELNSIAEDIRSIERKYRPEQSLPPEEEAMVVPEMQSAISDSDRAELQRLHYA